MIVVALLQLLGLALLGVTMHTAPAPVRRRIGSRGRGLRTAGWVALSASALVALGLGTFGLQVLNWCGLLSLSAAIVLLCFTKLAPRRAPRGRLASQRSVRLSRI